MKILTTNFLTCAVKSCGSSPTSFPLHFRDATLSRSEIDFQPQFILNILPRIDYEALVVTAAELNLGALVPEKQVFDRIVDKTTAAAPAEATRATAGQEEEHNNDDGDDEQVLKKLHTLFMETEVSEGKLVCANCAFEYPIKEGVANFLLPSHLV